MKSHSVRYLMAGVVVLAVAAGAFWLYRTRTTAATAAAAASTTFTQTVAVQQGNLDASLDVVGQLEAVQQQDLSFDRLKSAATLLSLEVQAGNTVRAGQALAAIDASSYEQALDQAKSALQEAEDTLTDLQAAATASEIAQADLAVARAGLDVQEAESNLAELEAGKDLTDLQQAVQTAQDNLDVAKLQQALAEHDSLAASERDLQYAVDYHQRLIAELQALAAAGKANAEQTAKIDSEQETLVEAQAQLAQVRAERQLALQAAAAQVKTAEAGLTEAQQALAEGRAGATDLDLAKARLAVQQAKVSLQSAQEARAELETGADAVKLAAAQADLDKKRLAVSEAEADLTAATLLAPFDGTVLEVNAEAGDRITAASTILTLANLDQLQVVASVDETTIRQVQQGQQATVSFDAFPGRSFHGQVLSVPLQGSLQGGVMVYEVPLSLDDAGDLPLLVGMTANVSIETGRVENALLVPTLALQTVNGMYQVLVANSADPDGQPVATPVEVGLSNGTYTQIVKGLVAGDQIVYQLANSQSGSFFRNFGGAGAVRFLAGPR